MSFRTLASSLIAIAVLGLAYAGPSAAKGGAEHIIIPRIGLNVPLSTYLDGGPIVYYRDADTLAIAGHRTTWSHPFNQLPALHRGDTIRVGAHVYKVRRETTVRPWQTWILNYRGLVLSTCYPAGSDAYRYVVFARQIS